MKKILTLVVIIMISGAFSSISAQRKKNKERVIVEQKVADKIILTTPSDTLSYATGAAVTGGLDQYLSQKYGIEEANNAYFLRGLKEAFNRRSDKAFLAYMAGFAIAEQIQKQILPNIKSQFKGTGVNIDDDKLFAGFVAALEKDSSVFTQAKAEKYFEAKRIALRESRDKANKEAGERFLSENAKKDGVITTATGLQYIILQKGTGPIPTKDSQVRVVYEGKTIDGKVFDATSLHGKDYDVFGVSGLIKGWTEALCMMPVGSKWTIFVPQDLAYGARGAGEKIAPYSTLIFTMELKGIENKAEEKAEPVKKVIKKATKKQK